MPSMCVGVSAHGLLRSGALTAQQRALHCRCALWCVSVPRMAALLSALSPRVRQGADAPAPRAESGEPAPRTLALLADGGRPRALARSLPAEQRTIPLSEIAARTKLGADGVEFLLMKTLSLKLIEGVIDQVDSTVQARGRPPAAPAARLQCSRFIHSQQVLRVVFRRDVLAAAAQSHAAACATIISCIHQYPY